MDTYRVTLLVEQDGPEDQNQEIVKFVRAPCEASAVEGANMLVQRENPSINAAKIWASIRELIGNRLVIESIREKIRSVEDICEYA
jgi:hypothetical protein